MHFSHASDADGHLLVTLIEPVSVKPNSIQLITKVEMYMQHYVVERTTGRLMIYLEKDSLASTLQYGDQLIIESEYQKLMPAVNPHAFDYSRHLSRKNIYHSTYIPSGQWHVSASNRKNPLLSLALDMRTKALIMMEGMPFGQREFAVLSALVLGYRELLDDDLRNEFAGAGAMHILCVSGLHVGIIYLILKNLLSLFGRLKSCASLRLAVLMTLIWLYAAITGFSPSVLRASVMFSFVALGHHTQKPGNFFNTLSASAIFLLTINPFLLAHIGFQLSYLAVAGIVCLKGHLYRLICWRYSMMNKIWTLCCVSLAAQLATGPLAVHYFNQFPNYFLITNLIAIPLAGLIIYLWLATFLFSFIPLVSFCFFSLLNWALQLLTHAVSAIESWPYSTLSGIYMPAYEVIFCFGIIAALFVFIELRQQSAFMLFLICVFLMVGSATLRKTLHFHDPVFVVYHTGRETVADFFTSRQLIMLATHNDGTSNRNIDFSVSGMRIRRGRPEPALEISLDDDNIHMPEKTFFRIGPFIGFHQLAIVVVCDVGGHMISSMRAGELSVDYLLVTENQPFDPADLIKKSQPAKVLLGGSLAPWYAGRWEEAARETKTAVWNVRKQGAYVGRPLR